ncbi:MAG: universal stress protein [Myxococcota bacterium]|nr:universal stress protein [Myxococcota bacterium]
MKNQDTYRIVVGHDLEQPGDEALREALALAMRMGDAEIHAVHVVGGSSRDLEQSAKQLDAAMAGLRARASDAIGDAATAEVPMQLHVRFGEAADSIHQVAIDYDADVVLVGTHGRSGLDRVRHGSIAEKLVRTARLPVLVAHAKDFTGLTPSARPDSATPGAELHQDQAMSEVLIARKRSSHIAGLI